MSAPFYNEDAEVRVGVVVRPLRGHWRPAGSRPQARFDDPRNMLDPSVWKTAAHDYDNEAKMQFTSKMVYSNHKLNEDGSASTGVVAPKQQPQLMAPVSKAKDKDKTVADSVLVSRCPSSCKCGASSTAITLNSPPPESNRIKLPPDLADEDQGPWITTSTKPPADKDKTSPGKPQVWNAKSKVTDGFRSRKEEEEIPSTRGSGSSYTGSSVSKEAPKKRDSSEEIKVTTRPLPKPQKLPSRASDKSNKSDKSDKSRGSSREKPTAVKEDQKVKSGTAGEKAAKDVRVTFDLQDSAKTYQRGTLPPGKDSRPTSPRRKATSGTETPEIRGQDIFRQEKSRPRANLTTTSRSRLKTVTYKEEPFMSEFKSWVLLIIFLSMIWLYRSTLFS